MEYTLNFNKKFLDIDESVVKDPDGKELTIGKELGRVLSMAKVGDALKCSIWAQKMYSGEAIKVDKSDFKWLEDFVSGKESNMINLLKGQILSIMDEVKTKKAKSE